MKVRAGGREIPAEGFGLLREGSLGLGHSELGSRMKEDGYLLLRGLLPKAKVMAARESILEELERLGKLAPGSDREEAVARKGVGVGIGFEIAQKNERLSAAIYGPEMMGFFDGFLGGPARHFDFTWLRTVGPGEGSDPHCDIVFMGRGTQRLFTAWTPLGDVPLKMGGLLVLEHSHRIEWLKETYGRQDVDRWCTNRGERMPEQLGEGRYYSKDGALSHNHLELQDQLGGRWMSADYEAGDVVVFCMSLVHGSLENQTDRIRITCDSRYQLASDPVDERWVGENPMAHGHESQREAIC